jgi:hypothetical protein
MIYFVDSPDDTSVRLAMEVGLSTSPKGGPVITWSDTARRRAFEVFEFQTPMSKLQTANPDEIRFTSMAGRMYRLKPLTLRLYNDFVRETVQGQPVFSSDAEVQRFYRESFGNDAQPRERPEPPLEGTGFDALDSRPSTR